jgi:predicted LPLAT superfamily acyltransferase
MALEKESSRALLELAGAGRGGILVGAHLGSFDLLRLVAAQHDVRVNVLMYTAHADRINAFFERLDPRSRLRVLPIDPSSANTALAVRHCVERGEFVGILADRLPPGRGGRAARVPFLGRPAAFPTTAFEIAALLGCPLLLALCVRLGDARYQSVAEVLYEGGRVGRAERPALARTLLERYVARLEAWCARAPYQWFNFYDFWGAAPPAPALDAPSAPASSSTSVPAAPRRT